jgi:hypothetical protein
VVMDNATFHKGGRIEELSQSVGCRLLYLPPYSSDLNRIKQRRVLAGESHPQTIRLGEIVYVMRSRMSYVWRPAPTKAVAIFATHIAGLMLCLGLQFVHILLNRSVINHYFRSKTLIFS